MILFLEIKGKRNCLPFSQFSSSVLETVPKGLNWSSFFTSTYHTTASFVTEIIYLKNKLLLVVKIKSQSRWLMKLEYWNDILRNNPAVFIMNTTVWYDELHDELYYSLHINIKLLYYTQTFLYLISLSGKLTSGSFSYVNINQDD